jgi:hypothetical protein
MDLEHFIKNYSRDPNLGQQIALYIIRPKNLAPSFENKNYFRAGVAGSRELANSQDRSATASGADSKASSLFSRAAMYFANMISGATLVAALILPPSVRSSPTGPIITRILQKREPGDNREAYQMKGTTMALALEKVFHQELDAMPKLKRARTDRVEWFESVQKNLENAKLAMQSVGRGIYYDLTKFASNVMPDQLVGKGVKLTGGMTMDTTTHAFRKSPRLLELTQEDVTEEDGSVRLSTDDIEEVRQNTERGQAILELITRRGPPKTQGTQAAPQTATTATETVNVPNVRTRSRSTTYGTAPAIPIPTDNPAPVYVRLTRARVQQLREAATTTNGEQQRKKLIRALAQLKN